MKHIIIIVNLVVMLASMCTENNHVTSLCIKNNTDERIYFWYNGWVEPVFPSYHFPDTIPPLKKPIYFSPISPHHTSFASGEDNPDWQRIFSNLPQGLLSVYFFQHNIESQEEWDEVRQNNDFIRIDVSYDELVANDYCINYP